MKYYVMYVANGNLAINEITEFYNPDAGKAFDGARAKYYSVCSLMSSDASVESASIAILDTQLDVVQGYKTTIVRTQSEPEA